MIWRPFIMFPVSLVLGCSSSQGLHPETVQERLQVGVQRFVGDQPPKPIPTRPSSQTVLKLGLYLNPTGFSGKEFDWTDGDRETVLAWAKGLSAKGMIVDASFIVQSSMRGNHLAELRESAARYGADLLLVLDGAASVDRYNNYKAWLSYWTILGAYFADGTHSDALCILRGSLWDVRTGSRLSQDEARGTGQQVGPAARIEDSATVLQARRQALDQLLTTVVQRISWDP